MFNSADSSQVAQQQKLQSSKQFDGINEKPFLDFIIIDQIKSQLLTAEQWDEVIKKKSLKSVNHYDLYSSLTNGIPFMMYATFKTQGRLAAAGQGRHQHGGIRPVLDDHPRLRRHAGRVAGQRTDGRTRSGRLRTDSTTEAKPADQAGTTQRGAPGGGGRAPGWPGGTGAGGRGGRGPADVSRHRARGVSVLQGLRV